MRTNKEIVNILKEEKDKQGLSISELARRVDMAKSAVSRYFNYTREFPLNRADDFARVLNITPEYLLGVNENKKDNSTTKQILDSVFSKLEEPRQDKVVAYAKSELDDQNKVVEIADYQIEKEYPCFEGIQLSPTPPRSPSKKPKQQPITQIKVASNNSLPLLFSTV